MQAAPLGWPRQPTKSPASARAVGPTSCKRREGTRRRGIDGASGRQLTLRTTDGHTWASVPAPPILNELRCIVPFTGGKAFLTAVRSPYFFDGTQWSLRDAQRDGGGGLSFSSISDCSGTAEDDIWVTGASNVWHWDGVGWTHRELAAGGAIFGVHARTRNEAWFTGVTGVGGSGGSILYRWNGSDFARVDLPSIDGGARYLQRVFAASADEVWAGGKNVLLRRTVTGGWTEISLPNNSSVLGIGGRPNDISALVLTDGRPHVARYQNDALTLGPRIRAGVTGLAVSPQKRRWVVGGDGSILSSDR